MVNPGNRTNPDFTSLPFVILRLELTNDGRTMHKIMVPEIGASTGPITLGKLSISIL